MRRRQPKFTQDAAALVEILRQYSPSQLASLMSVSDALAALNVGRFAAWSPKASAANSKPAMLAFDGDVYDGLQASTLDESQREWADKHLVILSGLYGILQPLDALQPYRLEMGTRLPNARGKDLYAWWGDRLAAELNMRQAREAAPVVVNLASQEYFRSIDRATLRARVVECVFEDWKVDRYKIISFFAKRARGLMARYAIEHRLQKVNELKTFDRDGYGFDAAASDADRLVFRRR